MFVFISHLTVLPEDHEALERHFRERSRLVDSFPASSTCSCCGPGRRSDARS